MPSPAPVLRAQDLVQVLGGRRVLDAVSLTVSPGRRLGVIGENGAGKSTLLRLLAGADHPVSGTVERPADLGFLHQELPFTARETITDVVEAALREARADLAALDRLGTELAATAEESPAYADLLAAYERTLARAQAREVWDADRRAARALDGLGLGRLAPTRTLGSLSGGQRGRLALAALLVRRPTALLLDEPTNHLDDAAAAFLEERLRELPGAVVLASHDRAFLDAVCTDLLDLDPAVGGPVRHGGTYTEYRAVRAAARARWEERYAAEQEEVERLRERAGVSAHRVAPNRWRSDNEKMGYGRRGNRVEHQVSRRVRDAHRRLADLERTRVPAPPPPLRFRPARGLALAAGPDGPLLALRDIRVPGRLALDRLDVAPGARLLVSGPNGAGKSTLLAVLAGYLEHEGTAEAADGLTVGLLPQDTVFAEGGRTAAEFWVRRLGAARAERVPLTALGLFAARDLDTPVARLSAGQRRRLALALLVANPPGLLLLDEPTNHLSPALCDELEEALGPGPGAIVLASHDRWLRRRWTGGELRLTATD
ncbi:ABC-F family ATP-binding cassette domain-containing protein [Streptomyces sp. NPDC088925]|uniref:ABC-F family ATP-binding cassette domain-containing protein n=1 Tax=Streptomyces sp. NPDC088925 TaxID=3365914 RepID=UPI00381C6B58